MQLSLCMIVRNESAVLGRCLDSVQGLVDEIILVDTGSTDGTQALAKARGARVFEAPWENDFSKARNRSLAEAQGRWILVLDADEQLLPKDREALRRLLVRQATGEVPQRAFHLIQRNSSDGGRTGMLVSIVRLFPNAPGVRYEWPIHEQVVTSLTREGVSIEDSGIEILHDGYADPGRNQEKQRRNQAILQAQVDSGREVYPLTHFLLAGTKLDLGDIPGALASYTECGRLAPPGDVIGDGARVRAAQCLEKLGRTEEALALMPASQPGPGWHPELLVAKGHCERTKGDFPSAHLAYASVFSLPDAVYVPPCNLSTIRIEAALGLAQVLRLGGKEALALQVLKSAVARHKAGQELGEAWLRELLAP